MKSFFFCFLFFIRFLLADAFTSDLYSKIKDIYDPSIDDYIEIQNYLSYEFRPLLNRLDSWQYRGKALEFRFIGRNDDEQIEHGVIPVNCEESDRNNCILLYCSFNHEYPKCLKKLVERIKNSDFKGHIIYRIGGWPDLEGGSLVFSHIPYAFKISSFREALRLGFKRAFWLDASVVPVCSLNDIFKVIEEKGYFTYVSPYNMKELANEEVCQIMGVPYSEADQIPAFVAGILGFNFENERALEAVRRWVDITKNHEEAYFSPRQDLCVISIILYQLGLTDANQGGEKATYDIKEIDRPGLQFYLDKFATQPNWPN